MRKSDLILENSTYYFGSNKNEAHLNSIISDPLFKQTVTYFFERKEQEIMLRQLKEDLQTEKNLEVYLEQLIKYNLLERKNRRYSLTFPVYSKKEFLLEVPDSVRRALQKIINGDLAMGCFVFGEWLWSLLFKEETGNYFFSVEDSSKKLPSFLNKRVEGNNSLHFISVFQDHQIPLDLANYFTFLSKKHELPKQFKSLETLVGDVDINYFIPQIQKIIQSDKRKKIRIKEKNIFQEALLATGDLKKNDQGQLYLATPVIENHVLSKENQEILAILDAELSRLWETIKNENQRVFFKKQLYSSLFNHCLPQIDSISYFKI